MTTTPDDDLDRLMARLADGERAVFSHVFTRLWHPVLRVCKGLLRHDADAADAAQEAMKKIFERASQYDPGRPALPWAIAIAGWECRTLARRRARRREVDAPDPEALGVADAEDDIALRSLADAAVTALGTLSLSDRETLAATFWDQASGVSGATLRKRKERALARLRSTFRRLYGND